MAQQLLQNINIKNRTLRLINKNQIIIKKGLIINYSLYAGIACIKIRFTIKPKLNIYLIKSFTTTDAMINPPTDGTNDILPGVTFLPFIILCFSSIGCSVE